jgi:hypothetical protein
LNHERAWLIAILLVLCFVLIAYAVYALAESRYFISQPPIKKIHFSHLLQTWTGLVVLTKVRTENPRFAGWIVGKTVCGHMPMSEDVVVANAKGKS